MIVEIVENQCESMSHPFRHAVALSLLLMTGLLVGNGALFCGMPCCQESPEPESCYGERSVSGGAASCHETVGTGAPGERCCMSASDEQPVLDQKRAAPLGSFAQPPAELVPRPVAPSPRRAESGAAQGAPTAGVALLTLLCSYLL